jgi:hypothetical protein
LGAEPLVTIALHRADRDAAVGLTYAPLEVIELEDNSSHPWNQALSRARGEYFIPLASGHRLMPDTIERLLTRLRADPCMSAVTCYLLGVERGPPLLGPRASEPIPLLASVKNVVASALFRTADLRGIGGFDSRADAASGDWSAFFKLVNAGKQVDLLPEHLFCRSSESADPIRNKMLKPFVAMDRALAAEREALWNAMAGYERRLEALARENRHLQARLALLKYRIADRVHSLLLKIPFIVRGLKWLFGPRSSGSPQRKQVTSQPSVAWPVAKNAAAAP